MPIRPHSLRVEIFIIVALKLLVIFGLWWLFVRDAKVMVDPQQAAQHLTSVESRPTQGETHAQ